MVAPHGSLLIAIAQQIKMLCLKYFLTSEGNVLRILNMEDYNVVNKSTSIRNAARIGSVHSVHYANKTSDKM